MIASSLGQFRFKGGMIDRHRRSKRPAHNLDLGIELLRERIDNGRAEPGFRLRRDAVRSADPVVDD